MAFLDIHGVDNTNLDRLDLISRGYILGKYPIQRALIAGGQVEGLSERNISDKRRELVERLRPFLLGRRMEQDAHKVGPYQL